MLRYAFENQSEMISPQLIYYKSILEDNIQKTIEMAGGAKRLWPHIKTHKMTELVEMQRKAGITRFKCATIAEAEVAVKGGAEDVLLAYPLVGPNIKRFVKLATDFPNVRFYAIADDEAQVKLLDEAARTAGIRVKLLMDIDMGQHRTGVSPEKAEAEYIRWSALTSVELCGMHCYDGHRHESSRSLRDTAVAQIDGQLMAIRKNLIAGGYDCSVMVMGGTPSFPCHAHATDAFLSPGTCIVQDAGYHAAYPDLPFVPGAAVLCRVISRPSADTFTVDMGTKAVASDPKEERAVLVGMAYAVTVIHNEEHWVLRVPQAHREDIPPIGTELFAIPTHICPTTALYPRVPVVENGKVIDTWAVAARNRKINY